jgi:hypothetical protein
VGAVVVVVLSIALWQWRAKPPAPAPEVETPPAPAMPDRPSPSPAPSAPLPAPPPPPAPPSRADLEGLAGPNGVVCEAQLDGGDAVGAARLEAELPSGFLGVATVGAGHVVLSDVPDEGEGVLHVEGFAPAALAWSPQGCSPEPLVLEPARAAVTGVVAQADEEVTVEVCGRPATLDDAGAFYADAVPNEPCTVRVRRHYGTFQWEAAETVTPRLGSDPVVEAEAPGPLAVLPVEWDEELRITSDWSGAGLEGRQVVAIDGEPPPSDPVEAHLLAAGRPDAEGGEVALTLEDGQVVSLELRVLSFEDWLLEH